MSAFARLTAHRGLYSKYSKYAVITAGAILRPLNDSSEEALCKYFHFALQIDSVTGSHLDTLKVSFEDAVQITIV